MTAFHIAPYLRTTPPFAIGLKPLDPDKPWLHVDHRYERYLSEKTSLLRHQPASVFQARPDTLKAQHEVLDLICQRLERDHPGLIAPDAHHIHNHRTGAALLRSDWGDRPLALAGLLVQEDLVIMRKTPAGWSLAAGSVCFPSSWRLEEKFDRPLTEIHAPVPGLENRPSQIIERIFDNLQLDQPVYRQNWSLYEDPALHHPTAEHHADHTWLDEGRDPLDVLHVRIEHQTLTRLPQSGDILFTILILVDPMSALLTHIEAPQLAKGLADQVERLQGSQLHYKGLTAAKTAILQRLHEVAGK